MNWSMYLNVSIATLILGVILACFLHRNRKKIYFLDGFKIFVGTIFVSAGILFIPAYEADFVMEGVVDNTWKAVLLAAFNTIHLFAVDGEVAVIVKLLKNEIGLVYETYICYTIFIAALISLLTFGFILSFFKNLTAYVRFGMGWFKDVYVFSELNKKAITLAEDLLKNDKHRMIVFTDYFESNDEESYELTQRVKDLGAICFKKDIHAVNFRYHSKRKELFFFVIGQDETENVEQSLYLIKKYKDLEKSNLYIFSSRVESELLLTAVEKGNMKVRRVNETRALVNRMLYDEGALIFRNAYPMSKNLKKIHAVIVGLGKHGSEMLKGLSWYCQMDGYEVEIDAFDRNMSTCERLYTQCPELLSEKMNGVKIAGEADYKINLYGGVDVDSREFAKQISEMEHPTYVFVALGSDAENVRIAAYLRMLFERSGVKPVICAVIYNSNKADAIKGITNFKKQEYEIQCIGDLKTSYSEAVILDSELEKEALKCHMRYANGDPLQEDEFWKYEYNYHSSVATAIHAKARIECKMLDVEKSKDSLTVEEIERIRLLEHRRWNAYMRSEGYCYSGSINAETRNDLGKLHHDLVPYPFLSEQDKKKDGRVVIG